MGQLVTGLFARIQNLGGLRRAAVVVPLGFLLAWLESEQGVPLLLALLSIGYLSIAAAILPSPGTVETGLGPSQRIDNPTIAFTKGMVLYAGSLLWVAVTVRMAPNDPLGLTVVLGPFGVLLLTGALYQVRARRTWRDPPE